MTETKLHDFAYLLHLRRIRHVRWLCLAWALMGASIAYGIFDWRLFAFALLFGAGALLTLPLFLLMYSARVFGFAEGLEPNTGVSCSVIDLESSAPLVELRASFGFLRFATTQIEHVVSSVVPTCHCIECLGPTPSGEDDIDFDHRITLTVRASEHGELVELPLPMSAVGMHELLPHLRHQTVCVSNHQNSQLGKFTYQLHLRRGRMFLWQLVGWFVCGALSTFAFVVCSQDFAFALLCMVALLVLALLFHFARVVEFVSGLEPRTPISLLVETGQNVPTIEVTAPFGSLRFSLNQIERAVICGEDFWDLYPSFLQDRITLTIRCSEGGNLVEVPMPLSADGVGELLPLVRDMTKWVASV